MTGDRRAAGAVEHREEGPLRREREAGFPIEDRLQGGRHALVSGSHCDRDRALPDGGQEIVGVEHGRDMPGQSEPAQARHGEKGRVDLAALELPEAGSDIAAQERDPEIRPQPPDLGLPPQGGGADDGAFRQGFKRWPGG